MPRPRFWLLSCPAGGVVEGIESMAAARYLSRVDDLVDRHRPPQLRGPTRVILAGRLDDGPAWRSLLGDPDLVPLLVSVELAGRPADDAPTLPADLLEALVAHGPVGGRDLATVERLEALDVPAYYSGCLTLTLPETSRPRTGGVLLVDVPAALAERAPGGPGDPPTVRRTDGAAADQRPSRRRHGAFGRFAAARALLDCSARARLVVTTNRTVAQAATALGTPSILLTGPAGSGSDHADLGGVVHRVPLDAAVDDPGLVDWSVDTSPGGHRVVAAHLDRTCREFVAGTLPGPARETAGRAVR